MISSIQKTKPFNLCKFRKCKITFFIIIILFSFRIIGQQSQFRFEQVDSSKLKNNLRNNSVRVIIQDSIGFLWLGTTNGLYKYDGYETIEYTNKENNSKSLRVLKLCEDNEKNIWIATEEGILKYFNRDDDSIKNCELKINQQSTIDNNTHINFMYKDKHDHIWIITNKFNLFRFNPKEQQVINLIPYLDGPSRPNEVNHTELVNYDSNYGSNQVWYQYPFCEDSEGLIWIGTKQGICCINLEKNKTSWYNNIKNDDNSLSHNDVRDIIEDKKGRIWIATFEGGLNQFYKKKGIFVHYRHSDDNPNTLSDDKICKIFEDSKGLLWLTTDNSGLSCFAPSENKFTNFVHKENNNKSLSVNRAIPLVEDSDKNLFILLAKQGGGIDIFQRRSNTFKFYKQDYTNRDPNGLAGNTISCAFKDKSGCVWIGSYYYGINKLVERPFYKTLHYKNVLNNPKSLSSNRIQIIYKSPSKPNIFWIGTDDGGLNRFDSKSGEFETYKNDSSKIKNLQDKRVRAIWEDSSEKILWIGLAGSSSDKGGLYKYDLKRKFLKKYIHDSKDNKSISHNWVTTIYEDSKKNLWLGTRYGGLNNLNRTTDVFIRYVHKNKDQNSLSGNEVWVIYEDRNGTLWIGTLHEGLNKFNYKTQSFRTYYKKDIFESVISICEDNDGNFWIGTIRGGLHLFDRDKFISTKNFTKAEGFPENFIGTIILDRKGYLWMISGAKLVKFDPNKKEIQNIYGSSDGLDGLGPQTCRCTISKDGKIFLGGLEGFYIFHPDRIKENIIPPNIVFTDFKINNESYRIMKDSPFNKSISTISKEIELNHKQNNISIDFVAIHFSKPNGNICKSKLIPENKKEEVKWEEKSGKDSSSYSNLVPGKYTFQVVGANCDGVMNKKGASIKLNINPPFWKTSEFNIIIITVSAIILYAIIAFFMYYKKIAIFWKGNKYINNFELIERIGKGGMGEVFKARNRTEKNKNAKPIAIKIIDKDYESEENWKRFKHEINNINQIKHPNIVDVIQSGIDGNRYFLAMEFIEGKTLRDKLNEEGKLEIDVSIKIMKQIFKALEKIHEKKIIHRDLKPENIMLLERDGIKNFVKILDFGISKRPLQTQLTKKYNFIGTLLYSSPEQLRKEDSQERKEDSQERKEELTFKSDIFSCGIIFYESITGINPFFGTDEIKIRQQILNAPPRMPIEICKEIPKSINKLILKMLENDKEKRLNTIEVLKALETL